MMTMLTKKKIQNPLAHQKKIQTIALDLCVLIEHLQEQMQKYPSVGLGNLRPTSLLSSLLNFILMRIGEKLVLLFC